MYQTCHWERQHLYTIHCKAVFLFENLQADFCKFARDKLGLPCRSIDEFKNPSYMLKHALNSINTTTLMRINEIYQDDFKIFGYKKYTPAELIDFQKKQKWVFTH